MTLDVVILQSAEADLHELRRYVQGRFGSKVWQESFDRIRQAIRRIRSHPDAGALPEELATLNMMQYQQVMAGTNRIIYEVRGATAYIHIICDARRNLHSLLMRRIVQGGSV